jgi:ribosomal protein S18 acetylase RimI-like enzyme
MGVEIEVLTEATDEAVAALARLTPQLSASARPVDAAALGSVLGCPANTVLLARVDGRIVGTLTLVAVPALSGLHARIEDVVVDEAARGSGVGAALTRAALRRAAAADADSVELTSRPSRTAANRLYRRLGFVPRETNVYRYPLP